MLALLITLGVTSRAAAAREATTVPASEPLAAPAKAGEATFLTECNTAMTKMMKGMSIKPTGNIDRDFVAMMIPHHQGAIDMAASELRFTHSEQLSRIAQQIVIEQLQEIAAMRIAAGEKVSPNETRLAASAPNLTAQTTLSLPPQLATNATSLGAEAPFLAENDATMRRMMNDMSHGPAGGIDRDFVQMMAPHHQGAIDMAQTELRYGQSAELRRIAQEIVVDQMQEIALLRFALGETLPPSVASPTDPSPHELRPSKAVARP